MTYFNQINYFLLKRNKCFSRFTVHTKSSIILCMSNKNIQTEGTSLAHHKIAVAIHSVTSILSRYRSGVFGSEFPTIKTCQTVRHKSNTFPYPCGEYVSVAVYSQGKSIFILLSIYRHRRFTKPKPRSRQ